MAQPKRARRASSFCWLAGLPLLALAACTAGPNYKEPLTEIPIAYRFDTRKNGREAAKRDQWWSLYRDQGLNQLMSQVRSSNQELRGGIARAQQARASLRGAQGNFAPTITASPTATRSRTSSENILGFAGNTVNTFVVPLDASWELDLAGRIKRNVEAASADVQASDSTLQDLLLSLEAEAATGYFTLRALDREIDIVEEEITSRRDSLQLAQDRFDLGATSKLDVSRAKSELETNKANLASLRRQRIAQETALAILAGRPASSFSIPHSPLSGKAPHIPKSIPSELLRARPDIRAAERQVAAANARIGVAQAALYPSLSLTGRVGAVSNNLNTLGNNGARIWSIGPELYLPIFAGGSLKANVTLSKAAYEETLANYQQTVLKALAEVESRLAANDQLEIEDRAQVAAVQAARAARQTARDQYNIGTTNYLTVLDAERTTLTTERAQATLVGSEFINSVNLIRALGGSW